MDILIERALKPSGCPETVCLIVSFTIKISAIATTVNTRMLLCVIIHYVGGL